MSTSVGSASVETSSVGTASGQAGFAPVGRSSLLAFAERGLLALRMTLAMVAAGLLLLAVAWQAAFPEQ